jgi:hypothetical protein
MHCALLTLSAERLDQGPFHLDGHSSNRPGASSNKTMSTTLVQESLRATSAELTVAMRNRRSLGPDSGNRFTRYWKLDHHHEPTCIRAFREDSSAIGKNGLLRNR